MSGSVNKVILIGNLGRDPEIRAFDRGGRVCNLSVACSERWKAKDGTRQEKTEWVRVAIFNENLVSVCEKWARKGSRVYLEGRLETRKWQEGGQDRYTTEVVLRQFGSELVLLDSARELVEPDERGWAPGQGPSQRGGGASHTPGDLSDEIPFAASM